MEIIPIGGFNEVGKNCTAVKYNDKIVLLDLGLNMDPYITHQNDSTDMSYVNLKRLNIVPEIDRLETKNIIAVVPSHGHLDHIGAVPFLDHMFKAPIICAPYTGEIIRRNAKDSGMRMKNKLITIPLNSSYQIDDEISIELIYATHSIPHSAFVAVHTPDGSVLYANDFKFDLSPTLGQKPNIQRLKEINPKILVCESLYAGTPGAAPSEKVAAEMLKGVMLNYNDTSNALIVTTFASHIARLKSIIQFGMKTGREILFLGRSLKKYCSAAEKLGMMGTEFPFYSGQRAFSMLGKVNQNKKRYLLVVTGHQGEPNSILSRMAHKETPFIFERNDSVIFSCKIIPSPVSEKNSAILETALNKSGVRIFRDIHVSGHGSREDLRELLLLTKPKRLIASHGGHDKQMHLVNLADEMGIKCGIVKNFDVLDA